MEAFFSCLVFKATPFFIAILQSYPLHTKLSPGHGDVITLATRDGQAFEVRQCQVKKGEDHMPGEKLQVRVFFEGVVVTVSCPVLVFFQPH